MGMAIGPWGLAGLSVATVGLVTGLALRALAPETRPVVAPPLVSPSAAPPPATVAKAPVAVAPAPPPVAAPSPAPAPPPPAADAQRPEFDVVRVEPGGEAVVAGRAVAGAIVALLSGDARIGETRADASGQFVIIPAPLPAGEAQLTLEARAGDAPAVVSRQTVTVSTPAQRKGGPALVALTAPDRPTRLLSDAPPVAAAAAKPGLAIRMLEADERGAFFASGAASPGAMLRLYLNDAFVAAIVAAADGAWSLTIEKGMVAGRYAVRVDMVANAAGEVLTRVEAPFDYPGRAGAWPEAPPPAPPASFARAPPAPPLPPEAPAASAVIVPHLRTTTVTRGDSLWRISRQVYGRGVRYTTIYDANVAQIRNPRLIFPGQVFVVPTGLN